MEAGLGGTGNQPRRAWATRSWKRQKDPHTPRDVGESAVTDGTLSLDFLLQTGREYVSAVKDKRATLWVPHAERPGLRPVQVPSSHPDHFRTAPCNAGLLASWPTFRSPPCSRRHLFPVPPRDPVGRPRLPHQASMSHVCTVPEKPRRWAVSLLQVGEDLRVP